MTKQEIKELIWHLRDLGTGRVQPEDPGHGICREINLPDMPGALPGILYSHMSTWPLSTGSSMYPVPHPRLGCFTAYQRTEDYWANDEYGNNRRQLCLYLANAIEGDLRNGRLQHLLTRVPA